MKSAKCPVGDAAPPAGHLALLAKSGMAELLKYALIIVSSVPILALYPFVQKYFVKGVMVGAVKG